MKGLLTLAHVHFKLMLKISVSYTAKSVTLVSPCCCVTLPWKEMNCVFSGDGQRQHTKWIYIPKQLGEQTTFLDWFTWAWVTESHLHHQNTYSSTGDNSPLLYSWSSLSSLQAVLAVFTLPLLTAFITVGGREPCKSCNFLTFLGFLSFSSFLSFMGFLLPTSHQKWIWWKGLLSIHLGIL